MGQNAEDGTSPFADNDGQGTAWFLMDHLGSSYTRSQGFDATKAKAIRSAAALGSRTAWNTAVIAAVGQTWWDARSQDWRDRAWQACQDDVATYP